MANRILVITSVEAFADVFNKSLRLGDKKQNWYKFVQRSLQVAQGCDAITSWASHRRGDGVVSLEDAKLGSDYDIQIETQEKLKGSGLPHLLQLGNNLVRQEIARALGVID